MVVLKIVKILGDLTWNYPMVIHQSYMTQFVYIDQLLCQCIFI